MMPEETIRARGHENVTARHKTTLEFTKEEHLTPRGDCIIAVSADRGLQEFSEEFKNLLKDDDAVLEITIECGGISEILKAKGHHNLTLTHPTDMVVRKSDFICDRTLAIGADKASIDLDRELVEKLKRGSEVIIKLKAIKPK
ncbi:MAG: DUF371 domain-containing protein [Candidatus Altiarchaeota archaeon]|nr:DUF371 domain-containing protein [Candidatus Altiarchaeota archaeon]MBU4341274.1 DUF371 domain-containing protein [Candidatus Altiarchaeota archaeon]MBU4406724.1 DUF371 domain-containing protein [Candidatus Altiarchaeota archaeon]MBU4437906.1 DUF371 domain-containing protein [Candidatus Altiarchaeota archaeon]